MSQNAIRNRAVITGIGAVTGYGWGREALWNGLLSGKPAARLHSGYGPDQDQDWWAALIPEGGDPDLTGSKFLRALLSATREAVADARDRGWQPGRTVGLIHAIVLGDAYDWGDWHRTGRWTRRTRDYLPLLPSTPISMIMQENGFHGPAMNVTSACSSGNAALITAKMWLDSGFADDVVCVTTDLSCAPEQIDHFERMGAAVVDADPLDASRPFQEGSRGFSFGEASVAFVVSRDAENPYAGILGGAMTNDAHHVISVDPGHERILECVRRALTFSGVTADEVRYYNTHGPGTDQCTEAELSVHEHIFDGRPHLYAIKPLAGHCQAASAGVEIAAAALGYERGVIPSAPIVAPAHPNLLDGTTPFEGGLTIKVSLGMGGNNSAVVLGAA
ncbi:beta-ketoacyl synthase N-terminal-like domain-containing protein [Nocardia huaxiensis]|uniref:3-oxoacyl-ACP synthase n=1 Tax=Nocardia huaxiensis TaxID=2755382 RepID=A0A7D6VDX7_9NOCA|nr:beta-ketoacyl synthase N-terminal-like domain-containing protein [Nocardia huaxiensis]QLY32242.1 3-oxoacyl-ACP synthase [Nocardia huaxiensis]UFS94053.1 3-oxoacyl-ACP synthase [Nocardia huaxiensis]